MSASTARRSTCINRDVYDLLETPEEMARLILQVTAPIPEGLPAPQYDQW